VLMSCKSLQILNYKLVELDSILNEEHLPYFIILESLVSIKIILKLIFIRKYNKSSLQSSWTDNSTENWTKSFEMTSAIFLNLIDSIQKITKRACYSFVTTSANSSSIIGSQYLPRKIVIANQINIADLINELRIKS
jgi:hypothetical protein